MVTIEPEIKAEQAKEKENKDLKDKVYGTKGTKRDSNVKPRVPDANKTPCKICNTQHKGECWFKNGGGGGNAGRNNRGGGNNAAFNKQQMKIMSKLIKSSGKKDDSDSKTETSADGWRKSINLVQQMFIVQQYRQDNGMHLDKEIDDIEKDKLRGL